MVKERFLNLLNACPSHSGDSCGGSKIGNFPNVVEYVPIPFYCGRLSGPEELVELRSVGKVNKRNILICFPFLHADLITHKGVFVIGEEIIHV